MDDAIRTALAAAAPDREVAAVEEPGGSANPGNRTVRVRFVDGETAYLKIAVDGNRTRLARAAATVQCAGERTPVGVPEVLATDAGAGPPYLLTAPLSGSPVDREWAAMSVDERADLIEAVGRALAGVHEARFDEPGRILGRDGGEGRDGRDGGELTVETAAWPNVVAGMIDEDGEPDGEPDDETDGESDGGRFAEFPARAADAVAAHRGELALGVPEDDVPSPALLHNDPRPENSFRGPDGVGFIDWEQAMVGDPVLDIVKTEGRFLGRPDIEGRERLRAALWEGYRDVASGLPPGFERRRGVYRVVTFLGVADGFDEWAPRVDEPTEELAAWVRSAFEDRIERIEQI
jgi:aminoglycoside phosphotransferase (APT) family kinase protein